MDPKNDAEFAELVRPFRAELHAYCYRILGSLADADDALQEALLGAWRGLAGFEGRSAFRSWLYRITTHACLRVVRARPRLLPFEHAPATEGTDLDPMLEGPLWLEPYPDTLGESYERRESVELAFVAALQHLPPVQRAALVLSDVLEFKADEIAELLATSVAAVNSALQRARASVSRRVPAKTQQATLAELGAEAERALVQAYVTAWARADVNALVRLLTDDVRFSMPPIPNWFAGREAVARFFAERVYRTPWRLEPLRASGQLAFACYQGPAFGLGALNVVTLRGGAIAELNGFLHPAVYAHFSLRER